MCEMKVTGAHSHSSAERFTAPKIVNSHPGREEFGKDPCFRSEHCGGGGNFKKPAVRMDHNTGRTDPRSEPTGTGAQHRRTRAPLNSTRSICRDCWKMFSTRLGLPLALLSLCLLGAAARHSDHLCMRRSFWKELMHGLENMNPVFSLECRDQYDESLETPAILNPADNQKASIAVEALQGLLRLFAASDAPLPRNQRLLFLNGVSQILVQLQSCMKAPPSGNLHQAAVRERFQKLEEFLLTRGSNNGCAWEIVHAVAREVLHEISTNHARK